VKARDLAERLLKSRQIRHEAENRRRHAEHAGPCSQEPGQTAGRHRARPPGDDRLGGGHLPAVLFNLGGELVVAGGDLVHQALALRRDLCELGLRLLAGALFGTQSPVLRCELGEELLFPLVGDALHRGDSRRTVEHEALNERAGLGRPVGRGNLTLGRGRQEAARDEGQKEGRGPYSVLLTEPGSGHKMETLSTEL